MRKLLVLLVFASFALQAQAQYKINGQLTESENYSWAILYRIEGARQLYVKNTKIDNNKFVFNLPTNSQVGMYRVSYQTQGAGYVDFLFNKENVNFSFNPNKPEESISFTSSKENKLFQAYTNAISMAQYKTDSLQIAYLNSPSQKVANLYSDQLKKIAAIQSDYAKKSKGTLAADFIAATHRYNAPQINKDKNAYLQSVISHYFDNIDFNNKTLYNSAFLINRITEYIFYINYSDDATTQTKLQEKAVQVVMSKLGTANFKKDVLQFLITQFLNNKRVDFVKYLFTNYYDKLPKATQDAQFRKEVFAKMSVEVGSPAPDFSWTENGKNYKLSTINDAKHYVLVFWSTSCSHCKIRIPQLYTFMQSNKIKNTKIIAYGLEESKAEWLNYIPKLKGWHHVLGMGKWENPIVNKYQIDGTPTYIVLNSAKKIIAKPNSLAELEKIISTLE